jgi:LPXTG-site transpeptidase (sortase) family protein
MFLILPNQRINAILLIAQLTFWRKPAQIKKRMNKATEPSHKNRLKEGLKQFAKLFVLFYLITFVTLQWLEAKGVINEETVERKKAQEKGEKNSDSIIAEASQIKLVSSKAPPNISSFPSKDNIKIPAINVVAPLIFVSSTEGPEVKRGLKKGVVHFYGSALPGEDGEIIILGHSAPPGWPVLYDGIFSKLNRLDKDDTIFLSYNGRKYTYRVTRKIIFTKNENVFEEPKRGERKLILLSCWPPGIDYRRIAIEAIEI